MNDEIKLESSLKGTRIILGETARKRRGIINFLIDISERYGFSEIVLPSLEISSLYSDKAGPEVLGQMYTFQDKGGRQLSLRPEGTATCQALIREVGKYEKDVKVWYEVRCWRYEQPQAGRYREFTQFGVEILNPTKTYYSNLIQMAEEMVSKVTKNYEVNGSAKRGLAYYENGEGFEISIPSLGAQKQVVGGGKYPEGIGFAIGVDRLMLI